jgi:hypothetical protein
MRYKSRLHEFVEKWLKENNLTWEAVLLRGGLNKSIGTDLRKGSTPRPVTLRKLADSMGIPRRRLFEVAGYLDAADTPEDTVRISDPDLRLFFRGGGWDQLTEDERAIVKDAITLAQRHRLLRAGAAVKQPAPGRTRRNRRKARR